MKKIRKNNNNTESLSLQPLQTLVARLGFVHYIFSFYHTQLFITTHIICPWHTNNLLLNKIINTIVILHRDNKNRSPLAWRSIFPPSPLFRIHLLPLRYIHSGFNTWSLGILAYSSILAMMIAWFNKKYIKKTMKAFWHSCFLTTLTFFPT